MSAPCPSHLVSLFALSIFAQAYSTFSRSRAQNILLFVRYLHLCPRRTRPSVGLVPRISCIFARPLYLRPRRALPSADLVPIASHIFVRPLHLRPRRTLPSADLMPIASHIFVRPLDLHPAAYSTFCQSRRNFGPVPVSMAVFPSLGSQSRPPHHPSPVLDRFLGA
jgi:hypothetical protein